MLPTHLELTLSILLVGCRNCYDALWHGYHKMTPLLLLTAAADVTCLQTHDCNRRIC